MKITNIIARQVIDSRGNPTVEADVELDNKYIGRSTVPSGASTGKYEALELRDGDPKVYGGQSVLKAVENVNKKIKSSLLGKTDLGQQDLDDFLVTLDGSESKSNLGANAILAVSLAYAWAASRARNIQLFEYIGELYGNKNYILPRPMFNIMNGGKHANWATDIQEYMILPLKAKTWAQRLQIGCEIYHALEKLLKGAGLSVNVGNEGGFAPALASNEQALELIVQAIDKAGYKLGEDVGLSLIHI